LEADLSGLIAMKLHKEIDERLTDGVSEIGLPPFPVST
jgi:hypothetical protein